MPPRLPQPAMPLLQAFIALWSNAGVGSEGPLVFLTVQLEALSDRLWHEKDDAQVLVYNAIAGAFGGFFLASRDPKANRSCCWLWCLLRTFAYISIYTVSASFFLVHLGLACWRQRALANKSEQDFLAF